MEWKQIENSNYEVSDTGTVRNILTKQERKSDVHYKGYLRVAINKKNKSIHRLVATYFIPNPNNYPQVNHINGIKTDNNVSNLEWCTAAYNNQHAIFTGLRVISQKNSTAIRIKLVRKKINKVKEPKWKGITPEEAKQIKYLNTKLTLTQIGELYNVHFSTIWDIRNNRTWIEI